MLGTSSIPESTTGGPAMQQDPAGRSCPLLEVIKAGLDAEAGTLTKEMVGDRWVKSVFLLSILQVLGEGESALGDGEWEG